MVPGFAACPENKTLLVKFFCFCWWLFCSVLFCFSKAKKQKPRYQCREWFAGFIFPCFCLGSAQPVMPQAVLWEGHPTLNISAVSVKCSMGHCVIWWSLLGNYGGKPAFIFSLGSDAFGQLSHLEF